MVTSNCFTLLNGDSIYRMNFDNIVVIVTIIIITLFYAVRKSIVTPRFLSWWKTNFSFWRIGIDSMMSVLQLGHLIVPTSSR